MTAVLESELIARSQQGDGEAFSSLVEPYLGLTIPPGETRHWFARHGFVV